GTVTLSGANTFSGAVTLYAGVLVVANNSALGTGAGAVTVPSGTAIQVSGTLSVNRALVLNGDGISSGGALRNTANANTWSGAITLGSSGVRINSDSSTLTIAGGITGSGNPNLTMGGVGT